MKNKKPDSDEAHIGPRMSHELGALGQGMAEGLEELAAQFCQEHQLVDARSFIATVFTAIEAMIFLSATKLLDHDERIPMVRAMMISLRQSLNRYHQEMEIDPKPRRDH